MWYEKLTLKTYTQKQMGIQLSIPHRIKEKISERTKNDEHEKSENGRVTY